MRCLNCDRENRDIARFCQYCGASLPAVEPPETRDAVIQPSEIERSPDFSLAQIPEGTLVVEKETSEAAEDLDDQGIPEQLPMAEQDKNPPVESTVTEAEVEAVEAVVPETTLPETALTETTPSETTLTESMALEATLQDLPLDGKDASAQAAEDQVSVQSQEGSSTADVFLEDLVPCDPSLKESQEEPAPDVGLEVGELAASLDSTEGVDDQTPNLDGLESQAGLSEVWADGADQDQALAVLEPAELEPIPLEETSSAFLLEAEETVEPGEPLAEVADLAAAELLPWSDRVEPELAPFVALEPGAVIDGRYQVIEVLQIEEQGAQYRVRDLQQCPRCGFTGNSPDEAFCASCGALMDQKPVATMLERVASAKDEPPEVPDGESFQYQNQEYWVWQEMKIEQIEDVRPLMRLTLGHMSDTGQVRELDEDALFVLTLSSTYESVTHQLGLYVVADGMGGHEGGEVASRIAIQCLAQSLLNDVFAPELAGDVLSEEAILYHLESAVHAANDAVYLERQKRDNDMGTTLTVALVVDWTLYLAHVGDCRAYRWGQDGLQQLTTDHSIVAGMVAAGTISEEDIYTHPQRSVIYRSIGDSPVVEVDLGTLLLSPDDRLVLCCDGLWEMIRNEGIEEVLLRESDPQTACEIMVDLANRAGGSDNISVIIVQL